MTILAFLSLVSSSIVSFVHLAFMSSVGVLTAFLSMVYVLPVIITSREKRHNKVEAEFLNSRKYERFGKFANSRWGTAFGIIIIVLFLSSVIFTPNGNRNRKRCLLPKDVESIVTSEIISDKFGTSYVQTFFILNGYDELVEFEKEIRRKDGERKIYSTINPQTINARRAIREFEKIRVGR
jgi:predicted RND superfamily exporter protein